MNTQYNDPKGAAGAVKVPLGLIPPYAMEQTAWVHKLGAEKYGAWNWRETGVCASTYVNAILRHLNAWRDGEDLDPESGISHLAHVACSANILMDAGKCGKLQDDRNTTRQCNEVEEADDDWDWLFDETENEYRILEKGDTVKEGDEHRFINSWYPAPKEVIGALVSGMVEWRRKITDCDLKDEVADCDLKETCDSEKEPQEECKCGRRYIYHWLYGWICEDCDLKHDDYYP